VKYLKAARREAGLSQEKLADMMRVHLNTIWGWENSDKRGPNAQQLTRLCEILKKTEAELLHGPKGEDGWNLTIKMEATQMLDLSGNTCISDIELTQNGAALRLGGSYSVFENDEKFEDFIRQLRSARDLVIESGRKMRNIGNKAEG
jgi:transcriptional regulator with XRE-family HTH domain